MTLHVEPGMRPLACLLAVAGCATTPPVRGESGPRGVHCYDQFVEEVALGTACYPTAEACGDARALDRHRSGPCRVDLVTPRYCLADECFARIEECRRARERRPDLARGTAPACRASWDWRRPWCAETHAPPLDVAWRFCREDEQASCTCPPPPATGACTCVRGPMVRRCFTLPTEAACRAAAAPGGWECRRVVGACPHAP